MDQSVTRWSVGLVAAIGLIAAALAGAAIWLLVTDPVAVSTATSSGDVGPLVRAFGAVLFDALRGLFAYL
jgi:hypothetical protein